MGHGIPTFTYLKIRLAFVLLYTRGVLAVYKKKAGDVCLIPEFGASHGFVCCKVLDEYEVL